MIKIMKYPFISNHLCVCINIKIPMSQIMIATDFSKAASIAADYALQLACYGAKDLIIFHVFTVPMPMISEGTPFSADQLYEIAEQDAMQKLSALRIRLLADAGALYAHTGFVPSISQYTVMGAVTVSIKAFFDENALDLVVIGSRKKGPLGFKIPGSTGRGLIKSGVMPLLLVPAGYRCLPPREITFASDFEVTELGALNMLCEIALPFNANLSIFHNRSKEHKIHGFTQQEQNFLDRVSRTVDYPRIFYKHKQKNNLELALEILQRSQGTDMLAMVHRKHGIIGELLGADHTLRIASSIIVPLLIFPGHFTSVLTDQVR